LGDKVVVTGIGVVSPLGLDVPSTWQGLVSGRSGIEGCGYAKHMLPFESSRVGPPVTPGVNNSGLS